jgi:TonB family protein
MRAVCFVFLLLLAAQAGFGQAAGGATVAQSNPPGLPKEPREILAAAAPFYAFSDASVKPWHLRASYQLYDDKGNAADKGVFEYWWVSPQVYRTSWTRGGTTQTGWYLGVGKSAVRATGEPLQYFEHKLLTALLSPLPTTEELDPAKANLVRDSLSVGGVKLQCVMVGPIMKFPGQVEQQPPLGLFPTYCFDSKVPVLRARFSMGSVIEEFNKIAKVQGHYLPQEVALFQGKQKILTATVDTITGLAADDSALTPPADVQASDEKKVDVVGGIAQGMLLKKQVPVYPQDAKEAHVSGKVVLQATIGRDGAVYDLHVVSSPWPSLAASALWSVSHWQYKPYLLNGNPVEVETTVNVIYALGN